MAKRVFEAQLPCHTPSPQPLSHKWARGSRSDVAFDVAFEVAVAVEVAVDLQSTLAEPFVPYRKWKKKWPLSERSEFRTFPIFCTAQTGTPKGIG
jgi:hypothetical protein